MSNSTRKGLLFGGVVLAVVVAFCLGLLLGILKGEFDTYHRTFLNEQELISPVLTANPAFGRIQIQEYSGGGAFLVGEVDSQNDRQRLRLEMARILGETKADFLVVGVSFRK